MNEHTKKATGLSSPVRLGEYGAASSQTLRKDGATWGKADLSDYPKKRRARVLIYPAALFVCVSPQRFSELVRVTYYSRVSCTVRTFRVVHTPASSVTRQAHDMVLDTDASDVVVEPGDGRGQGRETFCRPLHRINIFQAVT